MKNIQRVLLRTAAAAAIVGLGAPAFAANFDANIELDNTYLANKEVNGATTLKRGLEQSGRVEFNASGKIGEDTFVAGRATLLAKKDGTVGVDDMWFQLGNKSFDVKMGRFEAYNLFPTPGDVLVNHANTVYQTNTLRGRTGGATAYQVPDAPATAVPENERSYGQGEFHAAGTFKSDFGLALELGVIEFKQTKNVAPASTTPTDNPKGFRPVVSSKLDALSIAVGAEFIKYSNDNSETAIGATVGYNFGFMALNGNVAFGKDSSATPGTSANSMTTFGITGSSKIGLAGGVMLAKNEQGTGVEDGKVTTVYASYTHSLFDIKGATWSLGACSSTVGGGYEHTTSDDKGLRLRFNYTF